MSLAQYLPRRIKLDELCTLQSGGTPSRSNPNFYGGNIPWAKIGDLETSGDGFVYSTKENITKEGLNSINNRLFEKGTLLLAIYGSVGKVAFAGTKLSTNQAILGIQSKSKDKLNLKYLRYWFVNIRGELLHGARGVALKNLSATLVKNLKIPLPPLLEQKKIAEILDAADSLRQKDKQLIEHYNTLSQSLFLDMFGDPVTNPMSWGACSLVDHGKFKNGLNFKKGESGLKVKYLGVGNFKDYSKIDDIDSLGFIDLNKTPLEDYFLKDGDIIFVRSNGNGELVGRCIVMYPKDVPVTFSGFCIRYRVEDCCINVTYLAHLFREKSFRKQLLQSGRGANIQNINQKLLSALEIPLPPIEMQNKFAKRLQVIEKQKIQAEANLEKSNALFNSLLQRAFKGELTEKMVA